MKAIWKYLSITAFIGLYATATLGQKATLSGKVVDKNTGETLIGATILVENTGDGSLGTVTDFDGNYILELEPGSYDLGISYVAYVKQSIKALDLTEGQSVSMDFAMDTESVGLTEVVVQAKAVQNTSVSLLVLQKKAFGIQDGISSQQINQTVTSNAADAMKQVTGAVVEDGKYIVMRGLGDRYSLSQLNGITMTSTDPYRNSSSLDLIPSQMIENIVTLKTFTPDLPGNFTGGLVNITTRSYPENFSMNFSVNSSYNTQSSLIDNFNSSPRGKQDWLGIDDGSRQLPELLQDEKIRNQMSSSSYLEASNPDPANDGARDLFIRTSRALSNAFLPQQIQTPVNHGFNFSVGNRFNVLGRDLGVSLGLNYSRDFQYYTGGAVNTYIRTSGDQLFEYQALNETKSVENPRFGGLLTVAYKLSSNHSIEGNIIYNNDADLTSRVQEGTFNGQVSTGNAIFNTNTLEFTRRNYATYQLMGKHVFSKLNNTEIQWNGAITNSRQEEPDLRYFAYLKSVDDNEETRYDINNAEFQPPFHFFRDLTDQQYQGKVDISIPFLTKGQQGSSNRIKFGGLASVAERNFSEYRFQMNNTGAPATTALNNFGGNFEQFFDYGNFGIVDTTFRSNGEIRRYVPGWHYINQVNNKNFYTGNQDIYAAYLMTIYNLTPKLKAVAGGRLETTNLKVVSRDPGTAPSNIDQTDFLYSLNLIYSLNDKSNLRAAASRTLARPNMRELAPFEQFDTKNGFFNIGNPNLQRTLIQNYDVRYEIYPSSGELIAFSGFMKQFNDPIIRAFNPRATIPELTYINVDQATVMGVELELRKNLGFIANVLRHFSFSTNLALIQSTYDIPADELAGHKNVDSEYDQTTRPFQGQAPFIVNAFLSYYEPEAGWESSLSFNLSGRKLYNIALFATPDVYEDYFPLLNFKLSKRLTDSFRVSFTARNLINPENRKIQTFRNQDYVAESFMIGRTFGLSLNYTIRK